MLLKCDSSGPDECGCQKGLVRREQKICGFSNVEEQKWVSSGDRKIRGTAHTLADCNVISPHDRSGYLVPLRLVAITSLE